MFYTLVSLCVSLQINRLFAISDVQNLIDARTEFVRSKRMYGHIGPSFIGTAVPTRKAKHAVVSYEAQRIHIFLHDGQQFRRCVWHGHVTYDEKVEIVRHMMVWFNETTALPSSHLIVDHEDGTVFTDVLKEEEEVAVEEEDEM